MITIGRVIKFGIVIIPWVVLNVIGWLAETYTDNIWPIIESMEKWIRGE